MPIGLFSSFAKQTSIGLYILYIIYFKKKIIESIFRPEEEIK